MPCEISIMDRDHESVPEGHRLAPQGVMIAFVVEDASLLFDRLHQASVPIIVGLKGEPRGQLHVFVQDPAGRLVDITEFIASDP